MARTRRSLCAGAGVALLLVALGGCNANRRAIAPPPGFSAAQRSALSAQGSKDPERAISGYRDAVRAYPEFPAAWNNMGVLLMERQQYMDAAQAFANAAEAAPRDPRPLFNLGLTWQEAGYLEDGLKYYLLSLDREPTYLPSLRGSLRIERLLQKGDDKTLERIRLALGQEQDPAWRKYIDEFRIAVENKVYNPGLTRLPPPSGGGRGMYAEPPPAEPTPMDPHSKP